MTRKSRSRTRYVRLKPATAKRTTSAATACNVRYFISVSRRIAGATVVIAGVTGIVAVIGGASRILVHKSLLHHALACRVFGIVTAVSVWFAGSTSVFAWLVEFFNTQEADD
jgi:hypothetical protein